MAAEGEIEVEAGTEVETKGKDKTPEMLVILPSSLKTSSSVTSISSTTAASTGTAGYQLCLSLTAPMVVYFKGILIEEESKSHIEKNGHYDENQPPEHEDE